ncbi:MAG: hypothetical protein LAO55_17640 [Acidobacteriia bacterium]|nr:hypothetical protein [Terriglobia bacterium]
MSVTFKDYPNSNITTTTAAAGTLPPGTSFNFALFSVTPDLHVGWATLQFNMIPRLVGSEVMRSFACWFTANDLQGNFIDQTTVTLPPNGHLAFAISSVLPALANRLGTLYVTSDTNRLAAMGIRFNGAAFSSIPIMNWVGMFQ